MYAASRVAATSPVVRAKVAAGTPTITGNTITAGGPGLHYAGGSGGTASGNVSGFAPGNGRRNFRADLESPP
jgi:hypothetical protein